MAFCPAIDNAKASTSAARSANSLWYHAGRVLNMLVPPGPKPDSTRACARPVCHLALARYEVSLGEDLVERSHIEQASQDRCRQGRP